MAGDLNELRNRPSQCSSDEENAHPNTLNSKTKVREQFFLLKDSPNNNNNIEMLSSSKKNEPSQPQYQYLDINNNNNEM